MIRSNLLLIDSILNLGMGFGLVVCFTPLAPILGLPLVENTFWTSLLGAVLFGIGLALWVEWRRAPTGPGGLGLAGAVAINLCGGVCIGAWLLFGALSIPTRGKLLLWGLVVVLVGLSGAEWVKHRRSTASATPTSP